MNKKFTFKCLSFETLNNKALYDIMNLRQSVFIVEQQCAYLDADGKDIPAHHLLCYDDFGLAAYARLLPKGISYDHYTSIGRVVSASRVRRTGAGRQLMATAIAETQRLYGNTPIKISAQSYLLAFYQSFGFEAEGETYLEDDIPHNAMILYI